MNYFRDAHSFTPMETPPGEAPERLREEWVGVQMPLSPRVVYLDHPKTHAEGMRSGRAMTETNIDFVLVSVENALQALREHGKDDAADEWQVLARRRYGATSHISSALRRRAAARSPFLFLVTSSDLINGHITLDQMRNHSSSRL